MRFASLYALALACTPLCAGCGDKAAITLTVGMQNPALEVHTGALGDTLTGGFDLWLSLGKEATGTRSVSLGSFSVRGTPSTTAIDPVPVDAGTTVFPIVLSPGDDRTIHLSMGSCDAASGLCTSTLKRVLTQAEHDALCPGPAQIVGSVLEDGKGDGLSGSVAPSCL